MAKKALFAAILFSVVHLTVTVLMCVFALPGLGSTISGLEFALWSAVPGAVLSFALVFFLCWSQLESGTIPFSAWMGVAVSLAGLLLDAVLLNSAISQDPAGSLLQIVMGALLLAGWGVIGAGALMGYGIYGVLKRYPFKGA